MTPILTQEHPLEALHHQQEAFDAPHRPDTTGIRYTLWTEQHDLETADLNPCAQRLYRWLLERAAGGTEQEVDLEEFQQSTLSQKREKGYHIKHVLRSFTNLLSAGFVIVTRVYTRRVMRLIVRHAGSLKPIQLRQKSSQRNFQVPERTDSCQFEPETIELPSSIQRNSDNTELPAEGRDNKELTEIRNALANAPFMQDGNEQQSSLSIQSPDETEFAAAVALPEEKEFSTPVARTTLERLQTISVPLISEVRSLIARTPEAQLERNVSALEEEAAAKGLKSPIAALKYFVLNNCQPRNDRQAWWNKAAVALGRERRDRLIQSVTEYAGTNWVIFINGKQITLQEAQGLSWEAIAALGDPT